MQITSLSFPLFVFLLTVTYYLVPAKRQWMILLTGSLVFYLYSGIENMIYILITASSIFGGSLLLQRITEQRKRILLQEKENWTNDARKAYKTATTKKRRAILTSVLILNFGLLCVFKYSHFVMAQINLLFTSLGQNTHGVTVGLVVPLGISFYTFQSVGYLIDVYWGKVQPERNFAKLLLFISFFPQITQGPISDFRQLSPQLFSKHRFLYSNYASGCQRVLWGFFKKTVLADSLAPWVRDVFTNYNDYTGITVLLGAFMYSIQIYADFSGYMDIMCGVCEILDIRLSENFERPYFSKSVAEYWRRWHITLGAWFKSYLYYPIAVSDWNRKLGKYAQIRFGKRFGKTVPATIALVAVWFTTGLWHGASWSYISWGLINGFLIIASLWLEPLYERTREKLNIRDACLGWRVFRIIRTFTLMTLIKVLPEVGTLRQGLGLWARIFTCPTIPKGLEELLPFTDQYALSFLLLLCISAVLTVSLIQRRLPVRTFLRRFPLLLRLLLFVGLLLMILYVGVPASGQTGGFLYAQF